MDDNNQRLYRIRDHVERMSASEQHKVYNMLSLQNCMMNENNNGVFINLNTMSKNALDDLERAIDAFQQYHEETTEVVPSFQTAHRNQTAHQHQTQTILADQSQNQDSLANGGIDTRKKTVLTKAQTIIKRIMKQSTRRSVASVKAAEKEKMEPDEEEDEETVPVLGEDGGEDGADPEEETTMDEMELDLDGSDDDKVAPDDSESEDNMSEDLCDTDDAWRDNDLYVTNQTQIL
ncbi:hypothetical protein HK102_003968, partial [Quaeritorhiza haematococci]